MISLVLADDHPLFLEGVRRLVGEVPDIRVLGTASNGTDALRLIDETRPDVAILDVSMPEMTGIAIANRVQQQRIPTRVVMLSVFEDRNHVRQAIEAGARGYVLKRSAADTLVHAVRAVSQGGLYLDPIVAGRMLAAAEESLDPSIGPHASGAGFLTPREAEVLRWVAHGYTIKEVAAQLGITSKSVETYKIRASDKLQLGSRAKIVRYAMRQGWFDEAHG